jgi:hypothetical protein
VVIGTATELAGDTLSSEKVLWRSLPNSKVPNRIILVAGTSLACLAGIASFDGYALIFRSPPPMDRIIFINYVMVVIFLGFYLRLKLRPGRRSVSPAGQSAFTLTDRHLIIETKSGTQSWNVAQFKDLLNIEVRQQRDIRLSFLDAGSNSSRNVTLNDVEDPFRVACLIRVTLAPQTLTKNIKGNLA